MKDYTTTTLEEYLSLPQNNTNAVLAIPAKALSEIAGIDVYSDKAKGEIKGMVEILDELHEKVKANKFTQSAIKKIQKAGGTVEEA